jgi:aldose 1-epimerase
MTIARDVFGEVEGRAVDAYTITNANGLSARLITYGARLVSLEAPDKAGRLTDVVLGFDDLAGYVATDHYFGATCGRYGNRIRAGRFTLDGEPFQVSINEGENHLHGGRKGFDKHVWDAYPHEDENAVTFVHLSPAGDQGYPGELIVKSKYRLSDDNRLVITMTGTSTGTTLLNMVHHTYWNLGGHDSGSIEGHQLRLDGDFYTPVGAGLLLTGEIFSVAGTPFDFRKAKAIGADLAAVPNSGVAHLSGGGYDHNWVLRGFGPGSRAVAELWDPASGRGLVLRSTEPGVHVYTGGYISERMVGKGGKPYAPYAGLTFETQKFPDAPNFSHFPSARLCTGEVYDHVMEVQFFTR